MPSSPPLLPWLAPVLAGLILAPVLSRISGDPALGAPAPGDATGVYIDVHSYSELVLWPWGFTSTDAGNGAALQTLGRKLAFFNGYEPDQAIGLYPTDGTTIDFGYEPAGSGSIGDFVFIDSNGDGLEPASVWIPATASAPDADDVTRALDALLAGRSVDFTGPHPLARAGSQAVRKRCQPPARIDTSSFFTQGSTARRMAGRRLAGGSTAPASRSTSTTRRISSRNTEALRASI